MPAETASPEAAASATICRPRLARRSPTRSMADLRKRLRRRRRLHVQSGRAVDGGAPQDLITLYRAKQPSLPSGIHVPRLWRCGTAAASTGWTSAPRFREPNIDYATIARGMGVHGEGPIRDPNELRIGARAGHRRGQERRARACRRSHRSALRGFGRDQVHAFRLHCARRGRSVRQRASPWLRRPRSTRKATPPAASRFISETPVSPATAAPGKAASSRGPTPILAQTALPFDGFRELLRDPPGDMPAYSEAVLSDKDIADIYAFVDVRCRVPTVAERYFESQ